MQSADNAFVIDIDSLKKRHNKDSLQYYIWSIALNCKKNSRAFWALEKTLRLKDRIISIPLLILSSATGLTSVTLQQSPTSSLADAMVALGVSSACLVAIQRFTRYAERAEVAKHVAKSYARLARKVETTMVLVESMAVRMDPTEFLKFIRDVEKELDIILNDTDEIPGDLFKVPVVEENAREVKDVESDQVVRYSNSSLENIRGQVHQMGRCAAAPSEEQMS